MDKLDKTLGATQADRALVSGKATFAELVKLFKRDIELSERENSTKTKITHRLNGFIRHWIKVPELAPKGPANYWTRFANLSVDGALMLLI